MIVRICWDREWLLSKEAFSIYSQCMYHATFDDYKVQMAEFLSLDSVQVFVCEKQGVKTAIMVLDLSDKIAEIVGIAVEVKHRCQGIGKHLIQYVMESEQLKSVKAQTDDDSSGFYRKCGFSYEKVEIEYPDGTAVRYNCVLSK